MALSTSLVWELRTTGSDTNGGAFHPLSGTNTGANTDLVVDAANNLLVTAASHSFVSGDIGKYITITAGTGWAFGAYYITGISGSGALLERSPAPIGTASGTYTLYTSIDYSQQAAAQIAVTDLVTAGTTTITSTSAAFASNMVGNTVYITGGTGSITAARYEITAFTNSTTVTVDRSTGLSIGTGATMNLGGCLLTFGELASATRGMVAQNKAFIKSGTYGITAGISFAQLVSNPNFATPPTELVGYNTVRGDITYGNNASSRPTIVTNSAGLNAIAFTNSGWEIRNLIIAAGSSTPSIGFFPTGANLVISNCLVSAYSSQGFNISGAATAAFQCEATGGTSGSTGIFASSSQSAVVGCYAHDGVGVGIVASGDAIFNVVANQSGATSDGINTNGGYFCRIQNNTIYNCGRHGINIVGLQTSSALIRGNIVSKNGGWGIINTGGAGIAARAEWDGNAFFSNTSGTRSNLDDTTVNVQNAIAPYTNVADVSCSVDPFTNAAGGNFTLNNTAGGGAPLRGTSPINTWPGLTGTGYRDFGAIQHQDSGGSAGMLFIPCLQAL